MKKRIPSEAYMLKAQKLTRKETEHLYSRMGGKLERRLESEEIDALAALAIQLEKEDEDLKEWRERFSQIKAQKSKGDN